MIKGLFFYRCTAILGFLFSLSVLAEIPSELAAYEQIDKSIIASDLSEWTILVYIEADNNLSPCAVTNIDDMCKAASSKNVNLIVQCDKPKSKMTYRFKVENNKLLDVGSLNQEMGINPARELYDAMSWVKENYPAKHYMLVLWNHGSGILDRKRSWLRPLCYSFKKDQAFQDAGLSNARNIKDSTEDVAEVIPVDGSQAESLDDRGILYNDSEGTYLTTDAMTTVFNDIKTVLSQEIDVVGMDACLMAMLEIAYAIRNSTGILVGSENVEQGEGWNYRWLIDSIAKKDGKLSPKEMANLVVQAYKKYYLQRDPEFTQSALDLAKVEFVKDCVNQLVMIMLGIKATSRDISQKLLEAAYSGAVKFHDEYVDLYSFCDSMSDIVNAYYPVYIRYKDQPVYKQLSVYLEQLQNILTKTKLAIKEAVLSNGVGSKVEGSKGLSIYLPNLTREQAHPSYARCQFAKHSNWVQLLNFYTPDRSSSIEEVMNLEDESVQVPENQEGDFD